MRRTIPNDHSNFERSFGTVSPPCPAPDPARHARALRPPPRGGRARRGACSPSAATTRRRCPSSPEALGLAAGSLYHYFGGKEELLRAICDQLMDPLLERRRRCSPSRASPPTSCARSSPVGRARRRAPRPHARLPAGAPRDRARRAVEGRCATAARRSSGSPRTRSPAERRSATPTPPARALRAARDGQPHGAVVPPARAAVRARDRRRLRRPAARRRPADPLSGWAIRASAQRFRYR